MSLALAVVFPAFFFLLCVIMATTRIPTLLATTLSDIMFCLAFGALLGPVGAIACVSLCLLLTLLRHP